MLPPTVKSLNYLNNIFAKIEARQAAAWLVAQLAARGLQPSDVMVLSRKRASLLPMQQALAAAEQAGYVVCILDQISHAYGHLPLLDKAALQVEPGERIAIIGSNSFSGASFARYCLAEGLEVLGLSGGAGRCVEGILAPAAHAAGIAAR
jgi:ABC-type transport system involved in cytochrome bd biosynthesis fused ATPase/permease subunit